MVHEAMTANHDLTSLVRCQLNEGFYDTGQSCPTTSFISINFHLNPPADCLFPLQQSLTFKILVSLTAQEIEGNSLINSPSKLNC